MADRNRSSVTVDIRKNRLNISLSADLSKKQLDKIYTDIRFYVADLKPGFDVVTDLSQCTIGYLNGLTTFRKIMNYLVLKQPGEVIRVVGEMSLLFRQLIKFATRFQGYKPVYVTSLEEAEKRLASLTKRDGIRFQMFEKEVAYTMNLETDKGFLIDISISGCAIQGPTETLAAHDELSVAFPLHQDHETFSSFRLPAKVVRLKEGLFAVQFLNLDDDQKAELYKCLAYEAQREIPQK